MAEVPRHLLLPPVEHPLLDWWAEDYDHVFIAFNPFFRVPGYTPQTAAYGPIHTQRDAFDDIGDFVDNPPVRHNEAPEGFEFEIKERGQPVRWDEVQRDIAASDFNAFARTAWLWTLEVQRPDMDPAMAAALDGMAHFGLYPPEEDTLPVVMEPMIHRYLTELGVDDVTIWSEFRDEALEIDVAEFSRFNPPVRLPGHFVSAISCDDPKVLIAWNHDGVEAFIAMPDTVRRAAPPERFFEGRYAGIDTHVDWLNPRDFFPRKVARCV
ncbi:MAG: hypothetical protein VX874_05950 [Pseudomonadota bacterium]|nr:hypothetical protein [Pseudomonadota bacterium]